MTQRWVQHLAVQSRLARGVLVLRRGDAEATLEPGPARTWRALRHPRSVAQAAAAAGRSEQDVEADVARLRALGLVAAPESAPAP